MSGYRAHFSYTRKVLFYLCLGLAVSLAALWALSAKPLEGSYGQALSTLYATRHESIVFAAKLSAVLAVAVAALVFIASVLGSHRICGPIYRLVCSADEAAGGDFSKRVRVRRKDQLKGTVHEMDITFELIRARLSDIRSAAERMKSTAGKIDETIKEVSPGGAELVRLAQRLDDEHEELSERLNFFKT